MELKHSLVAFRALLIMAVTTLALNANKAIEHLAPSLINVEANSGNVKQQVAWQGRSNLPIGDYYVSVGRAQGSCSVRLNGILIDANTGGKNYERSGLFLGAGVKIQNEGLQEVSINCIQTKGSPVRLIHSVYIQSYFLGMFVHLVRFVLDLIFPPILVLLIGLSVIFFERKSNTDRKYIAVSATVFSALHIFSLINIPRLFLTNIDGIFLHSVLRVLSMALLLCWSARSIRASKLYSAFGITGILALLGARLLNQDLIFAIYLVLWHLIPIVSVAGFLVDKKYDRKHTNLSVMIPIVTLTSFDLFAFYAGQGAFFGPVTAITVFGVVSLHHIFIANARLAARSTIAKISLIPNSGGSQSDKLEQIARVLSDGLRMPIWSIYIDSYLLGTSPEPNIEYRRLASSNKNASSTGSIINFNDDDTLGQILQQSLSANHPIINTGVNDKKMYAVIPIAGKCVFNLTSKSSGLSNYETVPTFVEELFEQVQAVITSLLRNESASSFSSNLIRQQLGLGTHCITMGAIFADGVGYTANVKTSSNFVYFFEQEYIPNLLRNLGKGVILKDLFGDEPFFLIFPETPNDNSQVYNRTLETVSKIQMFVNGIGKEMCAAAGYKPIGFTIGAHADRGEVIVNETGVTINGPIIEAKRCLARATELEPFISLNLFDQSVKSSGHIYQYEKYAAKKEILEGYRLKASGSSRQTLKVS